MTITMYVYSNYNTFIIYFIYQILLTNSIKLDIYIAFLYKQYYDKYSQIFEWLSN